MLIGSPVPRDLPCALGRAVCYKYPPLNEVSCVYWYLVGGYSPQTTQKRLSLLTQRKLQNSPGSIYKYSFITCRREVIGIRRKTIET